MKKFMGKRWRQLAVLPVLTLIWSLVPGTSGAVLAGTDFEGDDGNLAPTNTNVDWNSFTGQTATDWRFSGPLTDDVGNPDSIFGGGVKQDNGCPATKTGSLGGGGNKFDIERLYLANKTFGTENYLFLAWVRVPQNSTSASSHVAFEFNRGSAALCEPDKADSLRSRSENDVLIVYDFEGGSSTPGIKVLRWKLSGSCEVSNSTAPCWGNPIALASGNYEAAVNTGTATDTLVSPTDQLGPVEFGEAAIKLSAAGLTLCDTSGYVTGVARTSGNSGTAQMKDRAGPYTRTLPGCAATNDITTEMGVVLTDSATIAPFNTAGSGDVTFTLHGPQDTDCDGKDDTTEADVDPVFEVTVRDITSGTVSTTDADDPDTDENEGAYTVAAGDGEYNWVVVFTSSDLSKNTGATARCGLETVTIEHGFVVGV